MSKRGGKKKNSDLQQRARQRARLRRRLPSDAVIDAVLGGQPAPDYPFTCPRCDIRYGLNYVVGDICFECHLHQLPPQYLNPSE